MTERPREQSALPPEPERGEQPGVSPGAPSASARPSANVRNDSAPSAPARGRRVLVRRALWGVVGVLLLGAGLICWQAQQLLFRPRTFTPPRAFVVQHRATWRKVAPQLEAQGIIPSAFALRVYARLYRQDALLKAGEYELSGKMAPVQIMALLNSGRVHAFWVTIPEGKWASEVEAYFAGHWPDAPADFSALVHDAGAWQHDFPFLRGATLEGYLFPDTYLINKSADARQIIATMLRGFRDRCWQAYQENPPADGRTFYEVLILASLIEAEAKHTAERPIIAGVYMNRLRKNMLLQCDATVLYAHRQRLSRVLFKDLTIDSPYNTYKFPGLPVGPICNPGVSSFQAALRPAEVPYLYYVAKGDGSHVFTSTLAEHNAAIRQIRGR